MTNAHDFGPDRYRLQELLIEHADRLSDKARVHASYCADAVLKGDVDGARHNARRYDHFCIAAEHAWLRHDDLVV